MRVLIGRDGFADAVSTILRVVPDQKDSIILGNLLLRAGNGKLALVGTDNELQSETYISAQISGEGEGTTIKAGVLAGIVAGLPKDVQISLEWDNAADGVTLTSGRSRYRLPTLPATDFPRLCEPENPAMFSIPGEAIAELLKAVQFARDKTRHYLSGVAMQVGNDEHPALGGGKNTQLELVACDGHVLARTAIPIPVGAHTMPAVILPGRTVVEIVRLSTMHPDLDIGFSVGRNGLVVRVADRIVTSKLINDTFPQYTLMIPKDNMNHVLVDVEDLSLALRRLYHLGNDNRTHVDLDVGLMKISLANSEAEAHEEIAVKYDGDNLYIGINASQISSILDHLCAEVARFEFGTQSDPVLIRAMRGGQPDYAATYLCMLVKR